jgi:hypothetical protein
VPWEIWAGKFNLWYDAGHKYLGHLFHKRFFVERSSTIDWFCLPPPTNLEMIASKWACFKKTNKYFYSKKNDTGYHIACVLARTAIYYSFFTIFKLRSTTEQMPALVYFYIFRLLCLQRYAPCLFRSLFCKPHSSSRILRFCNYYPLRFPEMR